MSGAAVLLVRKMRGSGVVLRAARHNRRAIQHERGADGSIDESRSHLNVTLAGPPSPTEVAALAKARMLAAGISKLRKDAVLGVEYVFALPQGAPIDPGAYFADCLTWLSRSCGGLGNILSADIHLDQAAPHCHVIVLPLIGGRMRGSELVGNRTRLRSLQADFHQAVAARYGLSRPLETLSGKAKLEGEAKVLAALRGSDDPALHSRAWPAIREGIRANPAPYLAALGVPHSPSTSKARTMTQIFISPGKGRRNESNHIGFAVRQADQNLSCVGIAPAVPPRTMPEDAPTPLPARRTMGDGPCVEHDENAAAWDRVREDEIPCGQFDPDSGEFRHAQKAS